MSFQVDSFIHPDSYSTLLASQCQGSGVSGYLTAGVVKAVGVSTLPIIRVIQVGLSAVSTVAHLGLASACTVTTTGYNFGAYLFSKERKTPFFQLSGTWFYSVNTAKLVAGIVKDPMLLLFKSALLLPKKEVVPAAVAEPKTEEKDEEEVVPAVVADDKIEEGDVEEISSVESEVVPATVAEPETEEEGEEEIQSVESEEIQSVESEEVESVEEPALEKQVSYKRACMIAAPIAFAVASIGVAILVQKVFG